MDTSTTDISAADLLRHASWLRRLLASLLADDRIDDAVQHTWLAALRRMPRNVGSLRSWLGAVARNSARDALRDRRRRREQELADRVDPQTPTPPAALERLEVTQAVVAAVRSLPEPYRGTVVRRYYSGQSIAEIATAMATTPANVRQRLSRGIAMLRQHLADRLGTDWRASLTMLALAGGSAAARPAAIAAIAVLLLGSAALALGMAWSTPPASPQADAATAVLVGTPPVAVQPAAGIGDGAPSLPRGHERVLVPSPAPPQPLRGRVVDPTGVPLGGVPVGTDRREPDNPDLDRVANPIDRPLTGPGAFEVLATSGADGSFAIGEPPVWSSLFSGGDFAPIVSFGIAPPLCQAQDVLIVATRAVSIAGWARSMPVKRLSGQRIASGIRLSPDEQPISRIRA